MRAERWANMFLSFTVIRAMDVLWPTKATWGSVAFFLVLSVMFYVWASARGELNE